MTAPSAPTRPLSGYKYFDQLDGLLARLRPAGTDHGTAGNRRLFFDQYDQLLLLYYFNPSVTCLRGVREFTTLEKVQRTFGIRSTALGPLSEAARVFDPALLEPILAELARRASARPDARPPAEREALAGLIVVDGSLPAGLAPHGLGVVAGRHPPRRQGPRRLRRLVRLARAGDRHGRQRVGTGRVAADGRTGARST